LIEQLLERAQSRPAAGQDGIEGRNVAQLLHVLQERRRRFLGGSLGFQPAPDDALNLFLRSYDEDPIRSYDDQERDHERDQNESH